MSRKFEAIDLLKLYTFGSTNGWNDYLNDCLNKKNINALSKLRYQICAGMDDLAKAKLNTDAINIWFVRLNRSIEITAKKTIKARNPLPGDNGLKVKEFASKCLLAKRKRDLELAQFMKESSY